MLLFPSAATACRIKLEDGEHAGASCVRDNSTAAEEQREGLHVFKAMECLQTALFIDEIQMCGYNAEEREWNWSICINLFDARIDLQKSSINILRSIRPNLLAIKNCLRNLKNLYCFNIRAEQCKQ